MRVVRVGDACELRRPAKMRPVNVLLPSGEEVGGRRLAGGIDQAGVGHDCRQPCRRESLFDPERRQRIDERSGVADQQESPPGITVGRIEPGVARPCVLKGGAPGERREMTRAGQFCSIRRRQTGRSGTRGNAVDHDPDLPHASRQRHRPHPAVLAGLDQRVGFVRNIPTVRTAPRADHRAHAVRRLDAAVRLGQHARTTGTIEHELAPQAERIGSVGAAHRDEVFTNVDGANDRGPAHIGAARRRLVEQQVVEIGPEHLKAGFSVTERFDSGLVRSPPDGVAAGRVEPPAFHGLDDADGCQQFARARRNRLGKAARSIRRLPEDAGRAAPGRKQTSRGSGGRAAADNRHVAALYAFHPAAAW